MEGLCMMGIVRGMIVDRSLPEELRHYYPLLDEAIVGFKAGIYSSNSNFAFQSNLTWGTEWVVPHEEAQKLGPQAVLPSEFQLLAGSVPDLLQTPREIVRCKKVFCQGRTFCPQDDRTSGDGLIQFRKGDGSSAFGEIRSIFAIYQWEGGHNALKKLAVVVEEYVSLTAKEEAAQPFGPYPDLEITMVRDQVRDPTVIDAGDILGHVVACLFELALEGGDPRRYRAVVPAIVSLSRNPTMQ